MQRTGVWLLQLYVLLHLLLLTLPALSTFAAGAAFCTAARVPHYFYRPHLSMLQRPCLHTNPYVAAPFFRITPPPCWICCLIYFPWLTVRCWPNRPVVVQHLLLWLLHRLLWLLLHLLLRLLLHLLLWLLRLLLLKVLSPKQLLFRRRGSYWRITRRTVAFLLLSCRGRA